MKYFIFVLIMLVGIFASILVDPFTPMVPVEQKVIEIHMTKAQPVQEESKLRGKTVVVPLPGHGTCSGEFVDSEGDILTAKHCVTGFESFEIVTFDQKKYAAVVVATSSTHDLALLHIDRVNTPYFKLANNVFRGDVISVLGSPLGITNTLTRGYVALLAGDTLLMDCGVLPGNSGGPVFNNNEELVGVVSAGYIVFYGTTHLNVALGLDSIRFFLKSALRR